MYANDSETNQTAAPTVTSEAADHVGVAPPKAAVQLRRCLGAGWRFARHLLEMVVAMVAGMAALGAALGVLGEPPGYSNPFVEYGLMGASMSAPMVAWMRYRGHSWADGAEMTAAMLAPMLALVLPIGLGVAGYVPGLSEGSLMMLSHVAMVGGMAALMIYRWDRYAHGARGHRAAGALVSLPLSPASKNVVALGVGRLGETQPIMRPVGSETPPERGPGARG